MNNKGQTQIGLLVLAAVAVIIGAAIYSGSVAPSVGVMTLTQNAVNSSYTAGAVNVSIDLVGQELINTPVVINNSNVVISSGNYTIAEGVSPRSGVKRVMLTFNDKGAAFAGKVVNVTYTYGPEGYVDDGGSRAVASLIPVMAALAILGAVFVAVKWDDWF